MELKYMGDEEEKKTGDQEPGEPETPEETTEPQQADSPPPPKPGRNLDEIIKALRSVSTDTAEPGEAMCNVCGARIPEDAVICPICSTDFGKGVPISSSLPEPPESPEKDLDLALNKCFVCGEDVSGETTFCLICGAPVSVKVVPVVSQTSEQEPSPEEAPPDEIFREEAPPDTMPEEIEITHFPVDEAGVVEMEKTPPEEPEGPQVTAEPEFEEMVDVIPEELQPPTGKAAYGEIASAPLQNGVTKHPMKLKRVPKKINGLVNGKSLVNGRSLVNGQSLVNGRAIEEGLKSPGKGRKAPKHGARRRSRALKISAILAVIAVLVLLAPVAKIILVPEKEGMQIDGDFSDWSGKTMYVDGKDSSIADGELDIVSYSIATEGKRLLCYLEVAGDMLAGQASPNGVDVVNIFIDTDGQKETGYLIKDMGADARVQIHGFDGNIKGKSVFKFDYQRNQEDWNGWQHTGSPSAAAKASKMEIAVYKNDIDLSGDQDPLVLFQVLDTKSSKHDFSDAIITQGKPALLIEQAQTGKEVTPAGSPGAKFLRLEFNARGLDVEINMITLNRIGDATDSDTGPVSLMKGGTTLATGTFSSENGLITFSIKLEVKIDHTEVLDVAVDVPAGINTRTFSLEIVTPFKVKAGEAIRTLAPPTPRIISYLGSAPPDIVIDGAFGDWKDIPSNSDPVGDTSNPDIDIIDYRTAKQEAMVSFYTRVDGTIMAGTSTPMAEVVRPGPPGPPGPGPGPTPTPPELVGVDTVRVFIDSDNYPATGSPVTGLTFGAEHVLVITGKDGNIVHKELFDWSSAIDDWVSRGSFEAANDAMRIEMQVSMARVGLSSNSTFSVHFYATDWNANQEFSDTPVTIVDPLQLTSDGLVNSSSDGNSWAFEVDISDGTFVDMTINISSGYVYVLANNGTVYESTGDWTSWTKIIDEVGTDTNFIALATDSASPQYFYAMQSDGDTFNTTGSTWQAGGDAGVGNNFVDMCHSYGTGEGAMLYSIKTSQNNPVFVSYDGGNSWGELGNNIGGEVNNVGIVNGSSYGEVEMFVLQTDGNIRNSTDGNSWSDIASPDNLNIYVDIFFDSVTTNGALWIINDTGKTYKYTFGASSGGSWSTLGSTYQTTPVAIVVNEIPEFEEILIPLVGTVALFVFFRRNRKGKNG
jgi:hypothetical protein